jgi:prophage regulatory protein
MTVRKSQYQIAVSGTGGMLLRLPALLKKWPRSKTTVYADIADDLFVPPVALGDRCSAWLEHEVDQIIAARIGGARKADIRKLVKQLVAARRAGGR